MEHLGAPFEQPPLRPFVDRDVRPSKAIDRLLGVTDQKELRPGDAAGDCKRYVSLREVSVLEFIDDEDPVPRPDSGERGSPLWPR